VPKEATTLSLSVMAPTCNTNSYTDTLKVMLDATPAITLSARTGAPPCGRSYQPVQVDVSHLADGQSHRLSLESSVFARSGFVVDKVSIAVPGQPSLCERTGPMPILLPALNITLPDPHVSGPPSSRSRRAGG
jgi:hypothetical protein